MNQQRMIAEQPNRSSLRELPDEDRLASIDFLDNSPLIMPKRSSFMGSERDDLRR